MKATYWYAWDGKLYESDIVRACIRPKVKAIGKLVGKHIRDDPKGGIKVNPEANIRFLLSEPNPYMTAQQMQEKVTRAEAYESMRAGVNARIILNSGQMTGKQADIQEKMENQNTQER